MRQQIVVEYIDSGLSNSNLIPIAGIENRFAYILLIMRGFILWSLAAGCYSRLLITICFNLIIERNQSFHLPCDAVFSDWQKGENGIRLSIGILCISIQWKALCRF